MVTIVDYKERQNKEGEHFNALILQGGVEMIKSETTGRYYATAKQASVPSTFSEAVCRQLIGTEMKGEVIKKQVEPYDYTIPETGEVITLEHTYEYDPTPEKMEEDVFEGMSKGHAPVEA